MVEQKNQFTSQQTTASISVPITKTDPLIQPTLSSAEKVFSTGEHSIKSNVSSSQRVFPTGDASMKGNVIPPSTVVHPPVFGTGLSGDIGTSLPSKPSISAQPNVGMNTNKTSISVGAPVFVENKMTANSAAVLPASTSIKSQSKVIPPAPTAPSSTNIKSTTTSIPVGEKKNESAVTTTGVPQPTSSEEKVSKLGKIKSAIKSKLHKKREENAEAFSDTSSVSSEEGEEKSKAAKAALGVGSAVGAATVAAGVIATGAVGVASAALIGSAIAKKHKESKDVEAYQFAGSGNLPSTGVVSSSTASSTNLKNEAPIKTGMGASTSGMESTQISSEKAQTGLGLANTSSTSSTGLGVAPVSSTTEVVAPVTTTVTSTSIPSSTNMMGTTFATLSSVPVGQASSQNVLTHPGISSTTLPTNTNASLSNNQTLSDQYMGKFINK